MIDLKEELMHKKFMEEFGFQPSEMDFQSGYDAATEHLMAIVVEDIFPHVRLKNQALKEVGINRFINAANLAEYFSPKVVKDLPSWYEFPEYLRMYSGENPRTDANFWAKTLMRVAILLLRP